MIPNFIERSKKLYKFICISSDSQNISIVKYITPHQTWNKSINYT
jgi:hypothetical protein